MEEERRSYRVFERDGTSVPFAVKVETTDLYIRAGRELKAEATAAAKEARRIIAGHGAERPEFLTSFAPLTLPEGTLHPLLAAMYRAARAAEVGPMAAVAGAVAEYVGKTLKPLSPSVTVENGGDIYVDAGRDTLVGLYAGKSPFSGKLALDLSAGDLPLAVCTSSGTVGPSISFGLADAATIVAADGALADAAASALGNRIRSAADVEGALAHVMTIEGVVGALVIIGDRMGCMGNIKLARV